ncbi:OmpA family protein [Brevundimonas sp. Root1279]|uniref:OmpA family protein n=1 Tax=Brevundimonas sp. Root1279 TaxID=1736443 RepID=UPI0009E81A97|nr:OmpA family protein [Brevundimonas sp. Root1279]
MKGLYGILAVVALAGCASTPATPERAAIVAEPGRCTAQRFEVYFPEAEARLTDAARQTLGATAAQLQGCTIQKVTVIGLADGSGTPAANQTLSEQRAVAVTKALEAQGWPAPAFDVEAAGAQGAIQADGSTAPMRRRTEVLVEVAPQ